MINVGIYLHLFIKISKLYDLFFHFRINSIDFFLYFDCLLEGIADPAIMPYVTGG